MCTVLVVDDDQNTLDVIGRMLRLRGHRVVKANTGDVAVAAVGTKMPDAVILDLNLGGGERGLDVLRRLQEVGFNGFTLVVSGQARTADLSDWQALNIYVALEKPFELTELLSRLEEATSLREHLDSAIVTMREVTRRNRVRLANPV